MEKNKEAGNRKKFAEKIMIWKRQGWRNIMTR